MIEFQFQPTAFRVDKMRKQIEKADRILSDLRTTFRRVLLPYMARFAKRQIDSEGSYGGNPWTRFSGEPKYGEFKEAITGSRKLYRWIGGEERLYPSYIDPNHPDNISRINRRSLVYGTAVPYAGQLEKGGIGPFGEAYPGRKVFNFKASQRIYQNRLVREDIKRRLRAAGLDV